MLTNALIQPHFDYASTLWYSSTPKRIKVQLQTAKNKLARLILDLYIGIMSALLNLRI